MKYYNFYNDFLSIEKNGENENFHVFWTHKTYPKQLVLALLEEGFRWNSSECFWESPDTEKTELAVHRFEKIAESIFQKQSSNNTRCISSSENDTRCIKKEIDIFNALKTEKDYQVLKEYLENYTMTIFNINAPLWEEQNIFLDKDSDGYFRLGLV